MEERSTGRGGVAALLERAAVLEGSPGRERRHETLIGQAESWGLTREVAEEVYGLAEEESLAPEVALLLASSGVGVVELAPEEADESAGQQDPPDWVASADLPAELAERERRLRLSLRRLRSLLERTGSAAEALRRFAAEPDVVEDAY